jgi:hypothetical protein
MPRLFALDKNFPQPIVGVLSDFQTDAMLVPLDRIDARMSTLDDWELLLALYHHADPWDGLISTRALRFVFLAQSPRLTDSCSDSQSGDLLFLTSGEPWPSWAGCGSSWFDAGPLVPEGCSPAQSSSGSAAGGS